MKQFPVKRILAMLVIIASVVGGVTFVVSLASKPKRPLPPPLPTVDKEAPDGPGIRISVTNHEGKKVVAAKVKVRWNAKGNIWGSRVALTDSQGMVDFDYDGQEPAWMELTVEPRTEPSIEREWGSRGSGKEIEIPEEIELKLPRGRTIGGIVKNDLGEPVQIAKVYVYAEDSNPEQESNDSNSNTRLYKQASVPTQKDGRWQLEGVPENFNSVRIDYSHSTHQPLERNDGRGLSKNRIKELHSRNHAATMKKGIVLTGTVTDPEGNPVSGALITEGTDFNRNISGAYSATTNDKGTFRYANAREMKSVLTVMHMDYAPFQMEIDIKKQMKPFKIELSNGKRLEFQVVNSDKTPLYGVNVNFNGWSVEGVHSEKLRMLFEKNKDRFVTNESGKIVWEHAPEGDLDLVFYLENYMNHSQSFSARDEPYTIVLSKQKRVIVSAVDAQTGAPISDFECSFGQQYNSGGGRIRNNWWGMRSSTGGEYVHTLNNNQQNKFVFKVKASGYKPGISEALTMEDLTGENKRITVKLEEGFGPKGVIRNAAGEPVSRAEVAAYLPDNNYYISLNNGNLNRSSRANYSRSDEEGKFELEPVEDSYGILVVHDSGYANIKGEDYEKSNGDIVLNPWVKVSGVFMEHGKPVGDRQVGAQVFQQYVEDEPRFYMSNYTDTDENGKFVFEKMLGDITVNFGQRIEIRDGDRSSSGISQEIQLELKSGEDNEIVIGGKGRPVIGKVNLPEGRKIMAQVYQATEDAPTQVTEAQAFNNLMNLIQQSTGVDLGKTVRPKPQFRRSYCFGLDDEGSFRIEEMLPGKYRLNIYLYELGQRGSWNHIGQANDQFEIPEMEEEVSTEPFDLGELEPRLNNQNRRF